MEWFIITPTGGFEFIGVGTTVQWTPTTSDEGNETVDMYAFDSAGQDTNVMAPVVVLGPTVQPR
jgi:hypothetical protein